MTINFKGKQYKVVDIYLKIHLSVWYFYDINQFINNESEICYGFLCFSLIKTLREIKENTSVGFKKQ